MYQPNSEEFTRSFSHLSKDSLVIILEDSLKQQQLLKLQVLIHQEQLQDCQEQLEILKAKTSTEDDTCLIMMYTQQRNVDKIERLEKALNSFSGRHKENIPVRNQEGEWESKYKELERHLDLYIGNSNKVQEELLEGCRKMKRENMRVYKEYQKEAYLSEEFRLRYKGLEMTVGERDAQIEELTRELEEQGGEIEEAMGQLKREREEIKEERQRIGKRGEKEKKEEKGEYMLIKEYKESTQRYSKLQEQLRSLQFRYSGLSKQRDILNNQINDAKQKSEQYRHQNHLLKQTISKLQQYNKGLLERLIEPTPVSAPGSVTERGLVETWSVEVKRLKKQIEDMDKRYHTLRDQHKRMINDKMLLEEKVRVIENTNQELLKENLTLSSELRMEKSREDGRVNCRTNSMMKHEDTEGESTIITSVEMNWVENVPRSSSNFLSHGYPKSYQ